MGRLNGNRTRIVRWRGGSPVLVRGQGETGRRDRIRTCTSFRSRVSETRVYPFHHSSENGADRGSRTLTSFRSPAPRAACLLFHHVRKTGASTGTCALLSALPRQSVAFYGLDAKMAKRKESHLRSPRGRRVYSALQLLLCHASMHGGSGGNRTRDHLLMRELR